MNLAMYKVGNTLFTKNKFVENLLEISDKIFYYKKTTCNIFIHNIIPSGTNIAMILVEICNI